MVQPDPGINCHAGAGVQMYDMPDYLAERTCSYLLVYIGPGEDLGRGAYYLFRVPEKGKANYTNGDGSETLELSHGNAWELSGYLKGDGFFIKNMALEKDGPKTRITRPLSSEMLVLSGGYANETVFRWMFPGMDGKVTMPRDAKPGPGGKKGITLGHMRSLDSIYEGIRTKYEEDLPYAGSPIMVWDGPYDRGLSGSACFFTMPITTEDIEHEEVGGTEIMRPVERSLWDLKDAGIWKMVFEQTEHESDGMIVGKSFGVKSRERIGEIMHPVSNKVCIVSGTAALDTVFDGLLYSLYPSYTE